MQFPNMHSSHEHTWDSSTDLAQAISPVFFQLAGKWHIQVIRCHHKHQVFSSTCCTIHVSFFAPFLAPHPSAACPCDPSDNPTANEAHLCARIAAVSLVSSHPPMMHPWTPVMDAVQAWGSNQTRQSCARRDFAYFSQFFLSLKTERIMMQ